MIGWLGKFIFSGPALAYLARLNNPKDDGASLRHVAYMVTIASGIIWLSVDMGIKEVGQGHRGIDANWVAAFALLLGAVTGAKVLGLRGSHAYQASASGTEDKAGDSQ